MRAMIQSCGLVHNLAWPFYLHLHFLIAEDGITCSLIPLRGTGNNVLVGKPSVSGKMIHSRQIASHQVNGNGWCQVPADWETLVRMLVQSQFVVISPCGIVSRKRPLIHSRVISPWKIIKDWNSWIVCTMHVPLRVNQKKGFTTCDLILKDAISHMRAIPMKVLLIWWIATSRSLWTQLPWNHLFWLHLLYLYPFDPFHHLVKQLAPLLTYKCHWYVLIAPVYWSADAPDSSRSSAGLNTFTSCSSVPEISIFESGSLSWSNSCDNFKPVGKNHLKFTWFHFSELGLNRFYSTLKCYFWLRNVFIPGALWDCYTRIICSCMAFLSVCDKHMSFTETQNVVHQLNVMDVMC